MGDTSAAVGPATARFVTDPARLPACRRPDIVELADGDAFDLRVGAVAKQLGDATVRMLAYNGFDPGSAPAGPARIRARRQHRQRRRHGDDHPLARAAPGQPPRRNAPEPGTDRGGRPAHLPAATGSRSLAPSSPAATVDLVLERKLRGGRRSRPRRFGRPLRPRTHGRTYGTCRARMTRLD